MPYKNIEDKKTHAQGYYQAHREQMNKASREHKQRVRHILYDNLGRVCVSCGYDDIRALTFDHIHDDGAICRRKYKGHSNEYAYLAKHIDEAKLIIQVMCMNCQLIKKGIDKEDNTL